MTTIITVTQAAQQLGVKPDCIRKHCVANEIGSLITPRFRALSSADVERLRGLIRASPGNPEFGKTIKGRPKKRQRE